MDSVRIVNTGSGSVRFYTNPNGYKIGSVEVQGGVLELSAPNSSSSYSLTDTILNELKITGGTIIGNATFAFDNLGSAYADTLVVMGNYKQTGGTLDFSTRTAGNLPGGALFMVVKGNLSQTGGQITATQGFGNQNQLIMGGNTAQNLELDYITGIISLGINNTAGVNILNNLTLPYYLNLLKGYVQLNNFDATVPLAQLYQAPVSPKPKVVTNGLGKLIIGDIGSGNLQTFPVAPFPNGYNQVTIANGESTSKTFKVRVMYGPSPSTNIDVNKIVNRTWIVNATTPTTANLISLKFSYADSEKVVGATLIPSDPMELGHFKTSWTVDPAGNITPTGGPVNYAVGSFTPASLDSSFIVGNVGFIQSDVNQYIFTGTGSWTIAANWVNNNIPPNPLPANSEIIIDPASGSCVLDLPIPQVINPGGKITVNANKSFIIPGNLIIQ